MGAQALGQVAGDLFQQGQVADVLACGRGEVGAVEVEAGAQGVLAFTRWRHIAFGAHYRREHLTLRGGRQAGDLATDSLERQRGARFEPVDIGGSGQYRQRCAGQQFLAIPGLPETVDLA
ncbi:hypothetical protein D9M71_819700 [compost metagenome]